MAWKPNQRRIIPVLRHGVFLAIVTVTGACESETAGPGKAASQTEPWFEEISEQAGLVFHHQTGATGHKWFPESYCGGAALLDYDNDGDLDVYFIQSGPLPHERKDLPSGTKLPGNVLFENLGNGKFADVTARAGVGDVRYGIAVASSDYDDDGYPDLYVLNFGRNVLYHNNGDGTFTDVTDQAGVGDPGNTVAAAFVDYDRDGRLDLYVVNYIAWTPEMNMAWPCNDHWGNRDFCSPLVYDAPELDTLYHNEGNGVFRDVSKAAGVHATVGNGMGIVASDLNGDDWPDLYVTNDAMPNQLWINNGDGTFRDEALLAGCAVNKDGKSEASMGVVAEDFDFDGDMDLFTPDLQGETFTFYRNDGGVFEDVTSQLGLEVTDPLTGFGPGMFDYDHDGLLDLFVACGRVSRWESTPEGRNPYAEPDLLLRAVAGGRFEDVSASAGDYFKRYWVGRGAAFGDIDNDGDFDILVVNADGPARLLRNTCIAPDRPDAAMRHWLMVKAQGRQGNRDAVGAKVTLVIDGQRRTREVRTAYGYASSNDPRVHFGLGGHDRFDDLIVHWPGGERERFGPGAGDRVVIVKQGAGTPASIPSR